MIKQLFNDLVTLLGFKCKPILYVKEGGVLTRASTKSAGYDLIHAGTNIIRLNSGKRELVKTGVFIALPEGYEAQVRPRSGLALKYGITVVNTPGTIDEDYRGEIGVILLNTGDTQFTINPGDRIAQLIFNKVEHLEFDFVNELPSSDRGAGGFGSTGK